MRDKKYPYIGRHVEDWNMEDVQAEDFELEQRNMVTKANREITGVDKRDDWPKVGDECVVTNDHGLTLIYGHEVIGKKVNVLTTYKTDNIDMAVVNFDGCGYCFRVDMLQKPKTPEQEIEYDLADLVMRARDVDVDDVTIARCILSKYNITKKEQGND